MPYESLDTSPDTQVCSKPDWQKQLLLKTVSSIQALGYVQRYVQHMKHVKYPITR